MENQNPAPEEQLQEQALEQQSVAAPAAPEIQSETAAKAVADADPDLPSIEEDLVDFCLEQESHSADDDDGYDDMLDDTYDFFLRPYPRPESFCNGL